MKVIDVEEISERCISIELIDVSESQRAAIEKALDEYFEIDIAVKDAD